jgi:hypothetical protein
MYRFLDFLMSCAIVFHQGNISTTNYALGHAMLLQCGLGLVIHTYWSSSCRFSLDFDFAPSRTFNSPVLCMCSVLFFRYTTSMFAWNSYVRLMHRLENCFALFISDSSGWICSSCDLYDIGYITYTRPLRIYVSMIYGSYAYKTKYPHFHSAHRGASTRRAGRAPSTSIG